MTAQTADPYQPATRPQVGTTASDSALDVGFFFFVLGAGDFPCLRGAGDLLRERALPGLLDLERFAAEDWEPVEESAPWSTSCR